MGRRKYNLCTKCGFRKVAPTGKACTAGVSVQIEDDKAIQGGQGPHREGLDVHDNFQNYQKAFSMDHRMSKIEKEVGFMCMYVGDN